MWNPSLRSQWDDGVQGRTGSWGIGFLSARLISPDRKGPQAPPQGEDMGLFTINIIRGIESEFTPVCGVRYQPRDHLQSQKNAQTLLDHEGKLSDEFAKHALFPIRWWPIKPIRPLNSLWILTVLEILWHYTVFRRKHIMTWALAVSVQGGYFGCKMVGGYY